MAIVQVGVEEISPQLVRLGHTKQNECIVFYFKFKPRLDPCGPNER
jgi:hypothetical protein